jgi:hypothetical protein
MTEHTSTYPKPQKLQNDVMQYFAITNIKDIENEFWVDMINYDGAYMVSNLGRIKSLARFCKVKNGGQRLSKEIIRKQVLMPDGRLSCNISFEGKLFTINVSAIIYFSFNTNKIYPNSKYCIMHKNKIADDNRLENLILETVTNSHKLNYTKQLLPHLEKHHNKVREYYYSLKNKTCCKCNVEKPISEFYKSDGLKCKICSSIYKKKKYLLSKISKTIV